MHPWHKRFLEAITEERERQSSRRRFLSESAKLAGSGALALAGAAAPVAGGLRSLAAQDFANDLDVANYALTLEHLEHAFYRDGLKRFDQAAFDAANLAKGLRKNIGLIRNHEKDHVDFLTKAVTAAGGTPVAEATYDFGYADLTGFLQVAMALENVGVSAYHGAALFIQSKDILSAALGIHSVEARHAAYLNEQNRKVPFPDSTDAPRTKDEVLKLAGPFIKAPTGSSSGGTTVASAVAIKSFAFDPPLLALAVGTTVTWTNQDPVGHTVTADQGEFDSGTLANGKTFSQTFDKAGTYRYHCNIHGQMRGIIAVQ